MLARRTALLAAAGLAVGAVAAFLLMPRGEGAASTTSTTVGAATTTTTAPPWVNRRETRLGPGVILATGLQMEGGRVLFTYEVEPITPLAAAGSPDRPIEEVSPAAPASFTLTYPGGAVAARILGPGQRAGRFDVPSGITLDQVQAISVDSYWVAVPAGFTIDLSPSSGAWVPTAPGLRARILKVVEQTENRLVVVEMEGEAALAGDLAIAGEGREWQCSSYSQLGGLRWTLDFRGETLPDPVRLVVRGVAWIEVAGGGPVSLEGIPR
ncbi:MAG: hypothetical protein ABIJ48_00515 [Actinomycetota bacterium]